MNQLLITALKDYQTLRPDIIHDATQIVRGVNWTDLHTEIKHIGRALKISTATGIGYYDRIILPGLLRYLAGEMGWLINFEQNALATTLDTSCFWYACRKVDGSAIFSEQSAYPDPLTAEIHAFAAIVERVKKERAEAAMHVRSLPPYGSIPLPPGTKITPGG